MIMSDMDHAQGNVYIEQNVRHSDQYSSAALHEDPNFEEESY
jgi:hypothetical protein